MRRLQLGFVITIFAAAGLGLIALEAIPERAIAAEEAAQSLAEQLKGTWILVGTPDNVGAPPEKGGRLKFYTGTRWCISEADPDTNLVKFHHGGNYQLDGNKMTSVVEYANESTKFRIDTTSKFEIKVEGDTYTQVGLDNPYTEVWKRVD